MRIDGSLNL